MRRFLKYGIVPAVTFIFLLITTVIVLPVVVNVRNFLPAIEKSLTEVAGRSVTIDRDLSLSFFPWLSISFSGLRIANPDGYVSDEFMKVESFEARIKLLPLLGKRFEISRFVVGGLEVNLEKRSDGQVNWEFLRLNRPPNADSRWFSSENVAIALFAVTDGTVTYRDEQESSHRRFDNLMLLLNNFTMKNSVATEFKVTVDGITLAAEGVVGPFRLNSGLGTLPVDLAINLFDKYKGQIKGTLTNPLEDFGYDLNIEVPSFAATELISILDPDSTLFKTDSTNFSSVSLNINARGDQNSILIENGKVSIDAVKAEFSLVITDFAQPQYEFSLDIDHLDLDRYLVIDEETSTEQKSSDSEGPGSTDYGIWRKVKLSGPVNLVELTAGGGTIKDIKTRLKAADGLFIFDPVSFASYQGTGQALVSVDFQRTIPQTSIDLKIQDVQANPLAHDFFRTDFLTGILHGDMRLLFSGFRSGAIKKSLYADGTLVCKDGAIVGIDMVDAINNIKDGGPEAAGSIKETRTDFSELKSLFSIRNGVIDSRETILYSPFANVEILGTADIVNQKLELLIEPEVIAVMGQEVTDVREEAKNSIPFSLAGSFTAPKISIDAQYLSLKGVNLPRELDLQSYVDEKLPSPSEDDVKNLVGTTLIDPAVVANRFRLKPEEIRQKKSKKQLRIGVGRITIGPLQEEGTFR